MNAWRSCPAARGQSSHVSTNATAECLPINRLGGKFPGSAQMLTQERSLRPPPMAEVATRTCLYMLVLEGSAHGRSRHLQMPLHARS